MMRQLAMTIVRNSEVSWLNFLWWPTVCEIFQDMNHLLTNRKVRNHSSWADVPQICWEGLCRQIRASFVSFCREVITIQSVETTRIQCFPIERTVGESSFGGLITIPEMGFIACNYPKVSPMSALKAMVHWIGLEEHWNRKPLYFMEKPWFPKKTWFPWIFSLKPIQWTMVFPHFPSTLKSVGLQWPPGQCPWWWWKNIMRWGEHGDEGIRELFFFWDIVAKPKNNVFFFS